MKKKLAILIDGVLAIFGYLFIEVDDYRNDPSRPNIELDDEDYYNDMHKFSVILKAKGMENKSD